MKTKHYLIALLTVAATIAVTTEASAFHRGRRASSRPIFSSGRPYLFSSATVTPQWTTSSTIAPSNDGCACVCAPCCRPAPACVTSALPPVAVTTK